MIITYFLCALSFCANDYYVKTTGTDNGDCSISEPCKALETPFNKSGDIDIHVSAEESSPTYLIDLLEFSEVRNIQMFSESTNPTTINTQYSTPLTLLFKASVTLYLKGFVISNNGSEFVVNPAVTTYGYFALFGADSANVTYENCDFKNRETTCCFYHAFTSGGGILNFIGCIYCNELQTVDFYSFISVWGRADIAIKIENCSFENISSPASTYPFIFSYDELKLGFLYDILINGSKFRNFTGIGEPSDKWGCLFGFPANNSESKFVIVDCSFTDITHKSYGAISVGSNSFQTFSVTNCSFSRVSSVNHTGCIFADYSATTNYPTLTVTDSNFASCMGAEDGGAIFANVYLSIVGCVFTYNKVPTGKIGGAVFINTSNSSADNLRFEDCVFRASLNSAIGSEGVLFMLINVSFGESIGADVCVRTDTDTDSDSGIDTAVLFSCATVKAGSCSNSLGLHLLAGNTDQSYLLPNCGECSRRRPSSDPRSSGGCSPCSDEECYLLEDTCASACPTAHFVLSNDSTTCELIARCSDRERNASARYPCGPDCYVDAGLIFHSEPGSVAECASTCTTPDIWSEFYYAPNTVSGWCEVRDCANRTEDTARSSNDAAPEDTEGVCKEKASTAIAFPYVGLVIGVVSFAVGMVAVVVVAVFIMVWWKHRKNRKMNVDRMGRNPILTSHGSEETGEVEENGN